MNIAVFTLKGGAGKTTLATSLAFAWRAQKPLLFDLDEQRSCLAFEWAGTGVEVIACAPVEAARRAPLGRLCLFDCPASLVLSGPVLARCDAVLIPVEGAFLPLRAAMPLQAELGARYPDLQMRFVLTRFLPARAGAQSVRDAAREEFGEALCASIVASSPDFDACAGRGETVLQGAPTGRGAKSIERLARELERAWNLHYEQ